MILGKKTIGVFINFFNTSFQHKVASGLTEHANKLGYNVLFFNTFNNQESASEYDDLEQGMFLVAPIEQLDAIVLLPDTFHIMEQYYRLYELIQERADKAVPIVSIRYPQEGCYQVLSDDAHALETVIRHVLDDHRCTRVCYMGGTPGFIDADLRLECFKRIMAEYDLPILSNTYFPGDYWKRMGKAAADHFYSNPDNIPQAIICANDYMAISLVNELVERGIRVPEDVIVTGYDDVPDARSYTPSITTLEIDYYKMAEKTVEIIDQHIKSGPLQKVFYIPSVLKRRESCGCMTRALQDVRDMRKLIFEQSDTQYITSLWQAYFTINITGCPDFRTLRRNVMDGLSHYPHYKDFYMMLCARSDCDLAQMEYTAQPSELMRVAAAVKDGQPIPEPNYENQANLIRREQLLPAIARCDEPCAYYIVLLHTRQRCFGYTAIRFEGTYTYDTDYQIWTIMISNAIDDLVNRIRLERALLRNAQMSVTDPLTGLLNRRGFEQYSQKLLSEADERRTHILMASFDLDLLKRINDRYGHADGDFAIATIAGCVRTISGPDGIASRSGGDEFIAMKLVSGDEDAETCRAQFRKAVEYANEQAKKPYHINAAMGVYIQPLSELHSIEEVMRESDKRLYQEKAQRRRRADD